MNIQKTLPKHYLKTSRLNKLLILYGYALGTLCRLIGVEPPFPCTPNLAADKWINWLHKNKLPPLRGHIIILALRNYAWMEWAMYAACWMRRLGFAPIILFSEKDVHAVYGGPGCTTLKQRFFLYKFWRHIDKIPDALQINVDSLPEPSSDRHSLFSEKISKQAHTDAAYELHVEEYEKGEHKEEYNRLVRCLSSQMCKDAPRVYELLLKLKAQYGEIRLIGFSGMLGLSACYEWAAKEAGLPRTWVEGWAIRPGLLRWTMNKPALDFDVRDWIENLKWGQTEQDEACRLFSFQETGEAAKEDGVEMKKHLNYQVASINDMLPESLQKFLSKDDRPVFLLATNVVGDSATFQRQTIFESQRDWILQVVRYFETHPDKRLIVRAHPSERVYELYGSLRVNLGNVAGEAAKDSENVYVVSWQDPVNTYALFPYIRAGLTWASNVGADLVVRGIPAISAARPVYEKLGITEEPGSIEEYFGLIEEFSKAPKGISNTQRDIARKYLYIVYKKIGLLGLGPRNGAVDLLLDHSLSSEYGKFYKIVAGLESPNY